MGIIDFREIVSPKSDHVSVKNASIGKSALSSDFELFCQEFFTSVRPARIFERISTGPDDGIDLGIEELLADGTKTRWLVSCKHKAHSKASVAGPEEINIIERLSKWECEGFIPFYTTAPSGTVKSMIEGVEKYGKKVDWYLKDRIESDLLRCSHGIQMAARYFPESMVNHYSKLIATIPSYTTGDVRVDGDMLSIEGIRKYVPGLSDNELLGVKESLVKDANVISTMTAHKSYFVLALKEALKMAPDFFTCTKTPETLEDFASVLPTWSPYDLYLASIDRANGRGLAFVYFIGAVWTFWSYSKAHRVFSEMMAFRSTCSIGTELSPDEVKQLKDSERFATLTNNNLAKGLLSPGLVGLTLQEEMRDIVARLFAFTNPIPGPIENRLPLMETEPMNTEATPVTSASAPASQPGTH